MDGAALWSSVWASYNPRDGGGAGGCPPPPPLPAPPAPPAAPPPPAPRPPPATPLPAVSTLSLESYLELADALVSSPTTSRRVKRVAGLAAAGIPTAGLKAVLALHGCGCSKGGKQDLLDRAIGMRLRYPTALADASPPDCDAAAAAAGGGGGGGLAVTAADLVALGWAAPCPALDAALAAGVDLSVSVEGAAASEAAAAGARSPPPPAAKRTRADDPAPSPHTTHPDPPAPTPPAVGDLVWVPLGAAWWPAEVTGVEAAAAPADAASAQADPTLAVTVLSLNLTLATPASAVKAITDDFEGRAGGATTGAGGQAVALARARLAAAYVAVGGSEP